MHTRGGVALIALGVLLLAGFAYVSTQSRSPSLTAVLDSSQSAAVWWSTYTSYQSWPLPLSVASHNNVGGWCNARYYNCPLPSYANIYVRSDPSQAIVARSVLPGFYFNFLAQRVTYAGALSTVPSGTPLTIEWACQRGQSVGYTVSDSCSSYDPFGNCVSSGGGGSATYTYRDYDGAVGTNFTAGPNIGSATVVPTQTTTYGIYCRSAGARTANGIPFPSTPVMSFTVNVSGEPIPPPLPPTTTIDAGAGNGITKTVSVGTSVTLTATYTAGSRDALTSTAINGPNSTNSVPGVAWTPPTSPKTYIFTPSTPGSYTFSPSLQSQFYPAWSNYGASVTVVATAATCSGAHQVNPPTCSCEVGYTLQGGVCVPTTCSDPHALPPLCNTCQSGYVWDGGNGACIIAPAALSISLSKSLVRKGETTTLSWSATGLAGSQNCSVSSSPAGVFSQTMPAGTAPTWSRSNQPTGPIIGATVFTLSCTGSTPVSVSAKLNPAYIEI